MVVFDASILLFILDENTPSSVPRAKERVELLIEGFSNAGEKIVIPTPALSECLVHAGPAGPDWVTLLGKRACFQIVGFAQRAAIESAIRTHEARQRGLKKAALLTRARPRLNSIGRLLLSPQSKARAPFTRTTPPCEAMPSRPAWKPTSLQTCRCHLKIRSRLWPSTRRTTETP